jgi:hypothetical protein
MQKHKGGWLPSRPDAEGEIQIVLHKTEGDTLGYWHSPLLGSGFNLVHEDDGHYSSFEFTDEQWVEFKRKVDAYREQAKGKEGAQKVHGVEPGASGEACRKPPGCCF